MKVVILAGGYGTRISEESCLRPKPMVEIGGKPMLWHIMKYYSAYGYQDFIVCAGYKQQVIKEYFANYYLHNSDISFLLKENTMLVHENFGEPWNVTIVDTGLATMTGGRLKRIEKYVGQESFMLTYGDGVSDVNLKELEQFHLQHGKVCTVTATRIGQRFGVLQVGEDQRVIDFEEKNAQSGGLVNVGFMVCKPEIFSYIKDDETVFEQMTLPFLTKKQQVMAFLHEGFWQCMDTLREKEKLEEIWSSKETPWKIW